MLPRRDHARQHGLRSQKRTGQQRVEHLVPGAQRQLDCRLAQGDACAVDQAVDVPPLIQGALCQRPHRLGIAHVTAHHQCLTALLFDGGSDLVERLSVARSQRDCRAGLPQAEGNGASQPSAGASHDHHMFSQLHLAPRHRRATTAGGAPPGSTTVGRGK